MIDREEELRVSSQLVRVPGPARGTAVGHAKLASFIEVGEEGWAFLALFKKPVSMRALLERGAVPSDQETAFEEAVANLVRSGFLVPADETEHLFREGERLAAPFRPKLMRPEGAFLGCEGTDGPADFRVIGVPLDRASGLPGARKGAREIRDASLALPAYLDAENGEFRGLWDHTLGRVVLGGARIQDHGDIIFDGAASLPDTYARITEAAQEIAALDSGTPVFLGGDHSITEPILRGLTAVRGPVFVVHFDAHTDLAPAFRGRPHHHGSVMDLVRRMEEVNGILQIGIRDVAPPWWRRPDKTAQISTQKARSMKPEELAAEVPVLPCYVSIDIDVLDPSEAPGTGSPLPGGLRLTELEAMVEAIGRMRSVVGIDLVEVSPELDRGRLTSACAVRVLLRLLDAVYCGSPRALARIIQHRL